MTFCQKKNREPTPLCLGVFAAAARPNHIAGKSLRSVPGSEHCVEAVEQTLWKYGVVVVVVVG